MPISKHGILDNQQYTSMAQGSQSESPKLHALSFPDYRTFRGSEAEEDRKQSTAWGNSSHTEGSTSGPTFNPTNKRNQFQQNNIFELIFFDSYLKVFRLFLRR